MNGHIKISDISQYLCTFGIAVVSVYIHFINNKYLRVSKRIAENDGNWYTQKKNNNYIATLLAETSLKE